MLLSLFNQIKFSTFNPCHAPPDAHLDYTVVHDQLKRRYSRYRDIPYFRSIQWQKLRVGSVLNISDSNKFGVWETLPGWGMSEEEHISLLRVRDVRVHDLATYRCHVTCDDRRGRPQHHFYYADICLKENNSDESEYFQGCC